MEDSDELIKGVIIGISLFITNKSQSNPGMYRRHLIAARELHGKEWDV